MGIVFAIILIYSIYIVMIYSLCLAAARADNFEDNKDNKKR